MTRLGLTYGAMFTTLTMVMSCVEPYDPPYSDRDINLLVVDGFLDSGSKNATVKLSYAMPLDTNTTYNPVQRATVSVEREDGLVIPLPEISSGLYAVSSDQIVTGKKFKLRVFNASKEYISDEVELRASPTLDSVTWRADDRGVTIYVDSHDEANSTRYYQWIYTETWEYTANKYSVVRFIKETAEVVPRTAAEMVYICYGSQTSTRVLITTTSSNTLDVVNDFALAFIPAGDYRLARLYSIEVEQRALDEQAYTYWLNLQKTTENLGGLFDPLPSEVTGNMHNPKDNSEKVLGYFSGGEIRKKRIFIYRGDLPPKLQVFPTSECAEQEIPVAKLRDYRGSDLYLIEPRGMPVPVLYTSAAGVCVDCTLRGGVTKPPSFWPPR